MTNLGKLGEENIAKTVQVGNPLQRMRVLLLTMQKYALVFSAA